MNFRSFLIILFGIILYSVSHSASSVEEKFSFEDESKRALFIELGNELRCPKCQNQNIADSNAVVAKDITAKVYELVKDGKSKDEIISYMKLRYGDFVHYEPPITPLTLWLWLLPLIFILFGCVFMFLLSKKKQVDISQEQLQKADEWLDTK
ncbi:cytochrome c-type biogenesis protein CcmH [Alteromonadaceae bacterium M269]|nr:cytochrome c-type biogenesis protein CcmH [Alteromonadaceae bacterium M269]